MHELIFFLKLYAFILLTSTLVPGINYFVVTTHPLHQLGIRYYANFRLVTFVQRVDLLIL